MRIRKIVCPSEIEEKLAASTAFPLLKPAKRLIIILESDTSKLGILKMRMFTRL